MTTSEQIGPESYTKAKEMADQLNAEYKRTGNILSALKTGPSGAPVSDAIRAGQEWKAASKAYKSALKNLQDFNKTYVKIFKAELAADRSKKRAAHQTSNQQ